MEIIPAIDIKQGRCVRLVQGDFGQETVFSNDPVEMALQWQSSGASRVHVVDLDGSKDGFLGNLALVERIGSTLSIPVQTGGGIRTFESANNFLSIGIDRIVLGTAAIENIEMDTFSEKDFFYSYRRTLLNKEGDYGRCISVILMT